MNLLYRAGAQLPGGGRLVQARRLSGSDCGSLDVSGSGVLRQKVSVSVGEVTQVDEREKEKLRQEEHVYSELLKRGFSMQPQKLRLDHEYAIHSDTGEIGVTQAYIQGILVLVEQFEARGQKVTKIEYRPKNRATHGWGFLSTS